MKLYNTLTRKVEKFIPNEEGKVKLYTCGPTVYSDPHIGNMRAYLCSDILEKALTYLGYEVTRVMNITDVGHLTSDSDSGEDKMVKSAKEQEKSVMDVAAYYTDIFFKDFTLLNNKVPKHVSAATKHVDEYIEIIKTLLEKGYAYQAGENVYFDTSKLVDYYQLTNHKEDDMVVGSRDGVEHDKNKKHQADFVLWFTKSKFQDQDMKWESPWGTGYPGWHIECTGICIHFFGESVDIHTGGVDHIFPHHTNEIAQSEGYLGHKWCNYWFHNEWLLDDTGKMSKSKGATLTVSLLKEKGYKPLSFRYMCLCSHYRKQMVFSHSSLNGAEREYDKLKGKVAAIKDEGELSDGDFSSYNDRFIEYISDDLNTANAITLLYDLLKDEQINGNTKLSLIRSWDKIFSLDLLAKDAKREDHDEIMKLINSREAAKKKKDFEMADSIRSELLEKGIQLLDTRDGTTYKVIGE